MGKQTIALLGGTGRVGTLIPTSERRRQFASVADSEHGKVEVKG
jgi:hypothetical protein